MKKQWKFYVSGLCLMLAMPVLAGKLKFKTINPFMSTETSARGIDNDGEIVGDFYAGSELGFLRRGDDYKKIKVAGARDTDTNGISNDDKIVGTYDDTLGDHGYVLVGNKVHKLPDPPAAFDTYPDFNAINEEGDVVGVVTPRFVFAPLLSISIGTGNKGFLLSEGKYTILDCGKYQTEANGINDDEDIVGECSDFYPTYAEHAFLLHEGKYHIFDVPFPNVIGTVALGLNNEGDIVGVYTDINFKDHGFIVHDLCDNPKWKTIDVPNAADTKVAAINDEREIVGTYTTSLGVNKGFKAEKEAY